MTQVQGLAAFQKRMDQVPKLVRQRVREAMEIGAQEMVDAARSVAPKGESGDLAASIGWTWGEAPKGSFAIGSVGGGAYATMKITIYAGGGDAFYARFQEFGTVNMSANPFFYPVWRSLRRRIRGRITRAMRKAIKEALA